MPVSCCSVVFAVFVVGSVAVTIASCNVPFFTIHTESTSSRSNANSATASAPSLGLLHARLGHDHDRAEVVTSRHVSAETLSSSGGVTMVSCPLFNGDCEYSNAYAITVALAAAAPKTDDLMTVYGCGGKLAVPRAFGVIGALVGGATFASAVVSMIVSRTPQNVRLTKLGCAGGAAAGIVCAIINTAGQFAARSCLISNAYFVSGAVGFGGRYMTMVSVAAVLASAGVLGCCLVGMVCSWFCACCGEPAGRMAFQQVPTVSAEVMVQPFVASPDGTAQPAAQYANYAMYPPAVKSADGTMTVTPSQPSAVMPIQ